MTEKEYIPRLADRELQEKLENFGAVDIVGCKWCGKTRTAKQFAKSVIELENPDDKAISLIKSEPSLALKGERPRLIDEWQDVKEIWDAVRYNVDTSGEVGQFILTGSSTPRKEKDKPKHSGAGRFASVTMRPMSLYESGDSDGSVSLKALFDLDTQIEGEAPHKLGDIAYLCARGGWPSSVVRKPTNPTLLPREYLKKLIHREDSYGNLDYYSPGRMQALLRSLARNTATPIRIATTVNDVIENTGTTITDVTVSNYLSILEQLYLIEDVEAWSPSLRSKTEIRTTKKRFLVDPSLAVASLYAGEDDLLTDANTFGLIFETMALRDLRIYSEAIGGELFYYRDKNGMECDAIVHFMNGSWGAIEIKLGSSEETIEAAATSLLTFKSQIDTSKMKEPSFLMILSGDAKYAYRREDGVFVVPIGCLKP